MICSNELLQYLYEMHLFHQHQRKKIKKMEAEIEQLRETVQRLNDQPGTNIERIEYSFDQLKIETLEGTLNIGLTPTGGEPIEEMIINQTGQQYPGSSQPYPGPGQPYPPSGQPSSMFNDEMMEDVMSELDRYLEEETAPLLDEMEQKYSYPLSREYRELIVNDINSQLESRVRYYMQQHTQNNDNRSDATQIAESITARVKEDIRNAVEAFIKHLPKGE